MATQLDILSKVMISLKEDRTVVMDNIMALLINRDRETNLVSKLKSEMSELYRINGVMQENEFFMIQIAQSMPKPEEPKEQPKEQPEETVDDLGVSSDGDVGKKDPSDK
jgi:hypothetical protein